MFACGIVIVVLEAVSSVISVDVGFAVHLKFE